MCTCEQWWLHCTSQWGWYMLLSEHVYRMEIAFKMTEQIEQWICIKFCTKLQHSSMETMLMTQKAAAMGNWWLAASSWQCAQSCITPCAEFFGETSNHPGDSVPLQPIFDTLQLLAFPKTKITSERKEIWDHQWDSGKYDTPADGDWENCVRSQGAYLEGDRGIIALCTMFLIACIFFNKYLFFIVYVWILSGHTLNIAYLVLKRNAAHLWTTAPSSVGRRQGLGLGSRMCGPWTPSKQLLMSTH